MTKDEALDLALEALEQGIDGQTSIQMDKAITAIKQARSAPVQEPVAFNAGVPPLYPEMKDGETISVKYTNPPAAQKDIQRLSALVRAQQITIDKLEQARSAPVQEPVAIVDEDGVIVVCNYKYKPGDKLYTTPPAAPVQEPEYVYTCNGCDTLYREDDVSCDCTVHGLMQFTRHILMPDTTPPAAQRQWVGLSDDEIIQCTPTWGGTVEDVARAIEAKLKEKNT